LATKQDPIIKTIKKSKALNWAPVALTCNSSYSTCRDQEDCGSKLARAKFVRSYLEKSHHKKRAGGVAQSVGPEFKPQNRKTNKQTKKTHLIIFITLYAGVVCGQS
jgi:hypothetical protein